MADDAPEVPSPIPLRPMTAADVLDGAIAVIKAAPRTIFVTAVAFVIPIELVAAWVQRDTLADSGLSGAISDATSASGTSRVGVTGSTIVLLVLSGLTLALVAAGVAHLVTSWISGRNPSPDDVLRLALRRSPAVIASWFVVHLIEAVAAIGLIVPAVLVMPLLAVTTPALVIERLGPLAAVRRSWRLVRKNYGAVLWLVVLTGLVSSALTIALSGLGLAFSFLSFGWIIDVVCRGASSLVTVPFVAAAATLVYLDLRIRTEGLDLDLDIAEHFASGR